MRHKVMYILPKFDNNTDTHFAYLYKLIRDAAKELDIALVIEQSPDDISYFDACTSVHTINASNPLTRSINIVYTVARLRFAGYRNVYVHYTFYGAIIASIVMRLSGGKVWYWNCGMPWLFGKQYMLQFVLKLVNFMVAGAPSLFPMYHEHLRFNPDKGRVLPTWIDIKSFREEADLPLDGIYDIPTDKKIVFFVHHLSEQKGAHMIVPVAKQFATDTEVHFVIAGSGPYEDSLKEEIANEQLTNISLLGRVPNKHVPALLKKSSVYFMPSNEEGLARTHLESIVAGVPYVVTNVGATQYVHEQHRGGVICESEDSDCLAAGVRKMLENPMRAEHANMVDKSVALKAFVQLFDE